VLEYVVARIVPYIIVAASFSGLVLSLGRVSYGEAPVKAQKAAVADPLDARIELERYEALVDKDVSKATEVLTGYDALLAEAAALNKAKKPSAAVVDGLAGVASSLKLEKEDAFGQWQRGELSVDTRKPCEASAAPAKPKAAPADCPGKGVLKILCKHVEALTNRHRNLAKVQKTIPDEVQTAYLKSQKGLAAAIELAAKVKTSNLKDLAHQAAKVCADRAAKLAGDALKSLNEATTAASKGASIGSLLTTNADALAFAARSAETSAALEAGGITLKPSSKELIEAGTTYVAALDPNAKDFADQLARKVLDAGDLYRRLLAAPDDLAIEAHAQSKLFAADSKKLAEVQKAVAEFAQSLGAKPLSAVVAEGSKVPSNLTDSAKRMLLDISRLDVTVAELNADHPENLGSWTEDEINLYYFEDVERLLKMLTPNVEEVRSGDQTQSTYETDARLALQSREALALAGAARADAQTRLAKAKEDLRLERLRVDEETRQLQSQVDAAGKTTDKAADEVIDAQRQVDLAQADVKEAQSKFDYLKAKLDVKPDDAVLKKQTDDAHETLVAAQKIADTKQADLAAAKSRQTATAQKATDSSAKLTALKSNVEKLETELGSAVTEEQKATEKYRTDSVAAYIDSVTANRSFAKSVENKPFFVTKRDKLKESLTSKSTDPVERVILYGEPMEKRIVIRGRPDDVADVRRLIALIDTPQAQSEITVYSAEMSSTSYPKQAERVRQALQALDIELGRYSLYNDRAQGLLRECISAVVNRATGSPTGDGKRLCASQQIEKLWGQKRPDQGTVDWIKKQPNLAAALVCYDDRILNRFPIRDAVALGWKDFLIGLPKLDSPGSLAEATLILSVLRPDLRKEVAALYRANVENRFTQIGSSLKLPKDIARQLCDPKLFVPETYLSTFEGLEFKGDKTVPLAGSDGIDTDVAVLQDGFIFLNGHKRYQEIRPSLKRVRDQLHRDMVDYRSANESTKREIRVRVSAAEKLLASELIISCAIFDVPIQSATQDTLERRPQGESIADWLAAFDEVNARLGAAIDIKSSFVDRNRDLARYNGALRRAIGRFYIDVNTKLVNGDAGLLTNANKIFSWSKSEVGAWASQTILASNRLAARLDPSATASAQQSTTIQAMEGALVLANLATSTATQSIPGILQLVKSAGDKQRNETPAIYGVGTGNVFEVTPVLDPTGQAVRFRFNFVAATRVQEPGGVSDRALNKIEQNSINTEVVLDNLAIRRVATFQSNVKLGLPASKTGGLPPFKDIPFLKEFPILGWFSYRIGGRRPVVQQSVILTQAAIYPTLEDVIGSLSGG
jgi:hypothetical protein